MDAETDIVMSGALSLLSACIAHASASYAASQCYAAGENGERWNQRAEHWRKVAQGRVTSLVRVLHNRPSMPDGRAWSDERSALIVATQLETGLLGPIDPADVETMARGIVRALGGEA